MPNSKTRSVPDQSEAEVLTLSEVAAYLRVPEEAVEELIAKDALPGQQVGGEWRFLKRAVAEWLRFGPRFRRDFRMFPPPWVDHPFWDDLFAAFEERILSKLPAPKDPKPGSKEAVLRHFGVFRDDADVEEQLAAIRARREAAGE